MGIGHLLSMFCLELQKLLKPIYDLTRKGRQFIWGKEQNAFEEMKCRLVKPPILHIPKGTGRFNLYSVTSKFAMGNTLYQIQNGKPELTTYSGKKTTRSCKKVFYYRIRAMQLSYKHSQHCVISCVSQEQNLIFWILDKLMPVSNMASSRSEENVNLNYYSNWWSHSYGETCNFFNIFVKLNWKMLADVMPL